MASSRPALLRFCLIHSTALNCQFNARLSSQVLLMKVLLAPLAATLLAALCHASTSAADTLHDIYAIALENDPQLRAAEATYSANIQLEKQAMAAMLPQLSGEASYREQDIKTTRPKAEIGRAHV